MAPRMPSGQAFLIGVGVVLSVVVGLSAALCRLLARRALWRGRTRSIASTRPAPPRVAPPARTNANDAPRTGRGDFTEQVVL